MRTLEELKNVQLGDMTREEQRLVLTAACGKLKKELETNSDKIQKVLNDRAP